MWKPRAGNSASPGQDAQISVVLRAQSGSVAAGSVSPHQCLAQGGYQPGQRYRTAARRPRVPIHPHQELPARIRQTEKHDLEVFISVIILNRNSQVGLHNLMKTATLTKVNRARASARLTFV